MPRLTHTRNRGLNSRQGVVTSLTEAPSAGATALDHSKARRKRRKAISPASLEQRAKVAGGACVVCGAEISIHPAHLIDRSIGGDDDPRIVVPLCFEHHRQYDSEGLSLLEHLEPDHREELAYAVQLVGILPALRRITNSRWKQAPS